MPEIMKTPQMRAIAKWGACALVLLAPGSFVILPLLWIARRWAARAAGPGSTLQRRSVGLLVTQPPRPARLAG